MTFSEYFNALYPYLSDGDKPADFFDGMIGHFIYEEAQESCDLLACKPDTKRRYIRKNNPNKIKPEYAQYAYSKHNPQGYIQWLNDRMYQQDSYDRIEEWLTANEIEFYDVCTACDVLLDNIFLSIAQPDAANSSPVHLPDKSVAGAESSLQLTASDKELLKEFCIDFDDLLEKCIRNDQLDVWFTSILFTKVNDLYNNKWKQRISDFEDISLQSDILSTVSMLQNFCRALDPDGEPIAGVSVRRLRIKLRDNYVKLHPDSYSGIYPYDAFIDDWNDGNEFDI